MISFRSLTIHGDQSEIKWYFRQGLFLIFNMSLLTGPGGNKHVSETEGAEIISDFHDQNDELDIDIKLEFGHQDLSCNQNLFNLDCIKDKTEIRNDTTYKGASISLSCA